MKLFHVGATRPTINATRLSAANDLVQRTLAQHGLASPMGQGASAGRIGLPSLDGMLSKLSDLPTGPAQTQPVVAHNAQFTDKPYSCTSGSRSYRLYVPASAPEGVSGVVMMLHGCTQTPDDFAIGTGMNALADQYGFVVIYPAQSRGDNAQSCWNWFSRGDQRRGRGEPAILAGLAQEICGKYDVKRENAYVAGLSAGAAMAVILGEEYADVFAAVGAHSGLPVGAAKDVASAFSAMSGNALDGPDQVQSDNHVRTILFHGTADRTVHPSNGDGIANRARNAGPAQSLEVSVTGTIAGRSYSKDISSNAYGITLVEHWKVEGQGHAWSGGQAGGSFTDPQGPDASAEMVRFFFQSSQTP